MSWHITQLSQWQQFDGQDKVWGMRSKAHLLSLPLAIYDRGWKSQDLCL